MEVRKIDKQTAQNVIINKHYTKRLGIFWEGFGLYDGQKLIGVCCYGQPSAPIQKHAFKERDFRLYELTRLVVDRDVKNGASILVGRSLQMLSEKPSAIISYADSSQGHCGIVYQATNWIYTGAVTAHDSLYMVNGEKLHPMTLRDRYGVTEPAKWAKENGYKQVKPEPKHRYFQFVGNRKDCHKMKNKLNYHVVSQYPKSEKTTYDDGDKCSRYIESSLF